MTDPTQATTAASGAAQRTTDAGGPNLIDRAALARHGLRAAAQVAAGAAEHPLITRIADDLADRLSVILRTFARGAVISPPGLSLAEALRAHPQISDLHALSVLGPGGHAVVDDEALPFGAGALDLIICALNLQVANDVPGAVVQAARALRPDGLFMAALFGERTLEELRTSLLMAEAEVLGGARPRVVPFGHVRTLGGLLQRAGLALPVADSDIVTVTYPSPLALIADLRAHAATNVLAARPRHIARRDVLLRALSLYQERYARADGQIPATVEIVTLTGWAPHPDQPTPLKPGSATTRLADALRAPDGVSPRGSSGSDRRCP